MKKKTCFVIIALLVIFGSVIVVNDYYRSVYVSFVPYEETMEEKMENTSDTQDAYDVFLPESGAKNEGVKGETGFIFFGDNLIHENVLNYANILAGGSGKREDFSKGFDFKPMYQNVVHLIEKADFAVLNQASLVGGNDDPMALSGYPLFNSPTVLGKDLIALGFDGVNIGNNHLLDLGSSGMKNSVSFWKKEDVHLFGGYLSEEEKSDVKSKIKEVNGNKIAFLSYTANTNGIRSDNDDGVPYYTFRESDILRSMLESEIAACKNESDLVIVMINWANSAGFEVAEHQKSTAKLLSDAGADVIIGSGPKTIQPLEWIFRDDGSKTLCAYSLGNFLGTMQYTENLLGGALSFDIVKNAENTSVENVLFHPLVIHYDQKFSDISVYPLESYTKEAFQVHGSNVLYGDTEYSVLNDVVRECISTVFLGSSVR